MSTVTICVERDLSSESLRCIARAVREDGVVFREKVVYGLPDDAYWELAEDLKNTGDAVPDSYSLKAFVRSEDPWLEGEWKWKPTKPGQPDCRK